jgi:hypothetical protein
MRQAIECPHVPFRSAGAGWVGRLLGAMFKPLRRGRAIRPDALSLHTLRDIGLAEDPRANHLLGDRWLRR